VIELRPTATPTTTSETLRDAIRALQNVEGLNFDATSRLNGWRGWVGATTRSLSTSLTSAALRKHILGDNYELLQSLHPGTYGDQLKWLIDTENTHRLEDLTAQADELDHMIRRWRPTGAFHTNGPHELALILDTNVLLEFGQNLERARWYHLLNLLPGKPLSLVIPIQVVEELDTQKDRGADGARKLAGMALRWLDELFPGEYQDSELAKISDAPTGRATFRLLVDALNRVPLPRPDADIIDRALALRPFVEKVTIVTQDRSMRFRARAAGLDATPMPYAAVPDGKQKPRRKDDPVPSTL
jgi:rRNA-processing protein FCF1